MNGKLELKLQEQVHTITWCCYSLKPWYLHFAHGNCYGAALLLLTNELAICMYDELNYFITGPIFCLFVEIWRNMMRSWQSSLIKYTDF